jgi:formylmethanofuran dehydrogenase subunit B
MTELTTASAPTILREVVCPFCSLACDNLKVEVGGASVRVVANGCPYAVAGFERPLGDPTPRVDGEPTTLETAVSRAAELLRSSRLPLLAGLGTDTAGARAAVALAEAVGGIVDHASAPGQMANLRALQDSGWVTTTLAEARNRADLLLVVGTDTKAVAPAFLDRVLRPGARLVDPLERSLVFLSAAPPDRVSAWHLPCSPATLPLVLAVLQGLVDERPVALPEGLDVSTASLAELVGQLRAARYALVVWAASELPGPHADLLVGRLAALLRSLNTRTRAAGFPLAGPDNIIGVNQVCAWQTGVPLRTSLASGAPDHDGWGYGAETLLAASAVDCLLWLTSFRDLEPPGAVPTIVLARPGFLPARSVDVLIPVGTPGLDHAGSVYRTDAVVSLPVRRLRDTALPSAAQVLERIRTLLP